MLVSVSSLSRLHVCFLFLALCFHAELRKPLCHGHSSSTDEQSLVFAGLGGIVGA